MFMNASTYTYLHGSCQEMINILPSKGKNIQGSFRKRPQDVISGIVFDIVPEGQFTHWKKRTRFFLEQRDLFGFLMDFS